jgi:hypothetical protein
MWKEAKRPQEAAVTLLNAVPEHLRNKIEAVQLIDSQVMPQKAGLAYGGKILAVNKQAVTVEKPEDAAKRLTEIVDYIKNGGLERAVEEKTGIFSKKTVDPLNNQQDQKIVQIVRDLYNNAHGGILPPKLVSVRKRPLFMAPRDGPATARP